MAVIDKKAAPVKASGSSTREALKPREKKILDYMKEEIKTNGYPPTVREICAAIGIKSTSTAHKDIASLVRKGYLKKQDSKTRTLVLTHDEEETAKEIRTAAPELRETEAVVDVPVVGRVAAGMPITAEENIESTFPVPKQYAADNCFMLRVKGESMINAGIMDGDLILVHSQNTADNGDIVVATIDGFEYEATVKTFYKEKDHIRLQPENDTMSPILVKDCQVQGKVRGVFRYFS
ncbi:MAG: transcriptional repressor LexA [Eubacterium sp.]|nr:transcriptional repressor LexA [Eubacterium sp.]